MKLKIFSICTLVLGVVLLLIGLGLPLWAVMNNTAETAIIGGADAPTYWFLFFSLHDGLLSALALMGIAFVTSALFCFIFPKTLHNHCSLKTSALSVSLSVFGGLGLVCYFFFISIAAFGSSSEYPVAYPLSILVGSLCLCAFLALLVFYFTVRIKNWSIKGAIIDVLTSILYFPAFFFAFIYLQDFLA